MEDQRIEIGKGGAKSIEDTGSRISQVPQSTGPPSINASSNQGGAPMQDDPALDNSDDHDALSNQASGRTAEDSQTENVKSQDDAVSSNSAPVDGQPDSSSTRVTESNQQTSNTERISLTNSTGPFGVGVRKGPAVPITATPAASIPATESVKSKRKTRCFARKTTCPLRFRDEFIAKRKKETENWRAKAARKAGGYGSSEDDSERSLERREINSSTPTDEESSPHTHGETDSESQEDEVSSSGGSDDYHSYSAATQVTSSDQEDSTSQDNDKSSAVPSSNEDDPQVEDNATIQDGASTSNDPRHSGPNNSFTNSEPSNQTEANTSLGNALSPIAVSKSFQPHASSNETQRSLGESQTVSQHIPSASGAVGTREARGGTKSRERSTRRKRQTAIKSTGGLQYFSLFYTARSPCTRNVGTSTRELQPSLTTSQTQTSPPSSPTPTPSTSVVKSPSEKRYIGRLSTGGRCSRSKYGEEGNVGMSETMHRSGPSIASQPGISKKHSQKQMARKSTGGLRRLPEYTSLNIFSSSRLGKTSSTNSTIASGNDNNTVSEVLATMSPSVPKVEKRRAKEAQTDEASGGVEERSPNQGPPSTASDVERKDCTLAKSSPGSATKRLLPPADHGTEKSSLSRELRALQFTNPGQSNAFLDRGLGYPEESRFLRKRRK